MSKMVSVFFYGSFMRPDVMDKAGFVPERVDVAKLSGYDICLDPHANIFPHHFSSVYGVVVRATHADLNRMYGTSGVGTFLPEAVLITTTDSQWIPALCFMPPSRSEHKPDHVYLARLIEAATFRGLPQEYVARLEKLKTE